MRSFVLKTQALPTLLAAVGLLLPGVGTQAQGRVHTPPVGSAERKAIMDTLRKPVETRLNRPVLFRVPTPAGFRAQDGWVFLTAELHKPDGSPVDLRGTPYAGPFHSNEVDALLHRAGGRWHVVALVLCATDVEWGEWSRKYHAPRAIFPPSD